MSGDKVRIIIGPSFSLSEVCRVLDRTLALGLELRGCEIIPIYCDSFQEAECNCVGGDWGGGESWAANCKRCRSLSEQMWSPFSKQLLKLSNYKLPEDEMFISDTLNHLEFSDLSNSRLVVLLLGNLLRTYCNNYLSASPEIVPNGHHLLYTHIKNLMLLSFCYKRLLKDVRPDRVISNDSFYGMWNVLQSACKELSPFYSHWLATKTRVALLQMMPQ